MRRILLSTLAIASSLAHAAPDCAGRFSTNKHPGDFFRSGVIYRLARAARDVGEAAHQALTELGQTDKYAYDDGMLFPAYTHPHLEPIDLKKLRLTGWEYALFRGAEWIDSGVVDAPVNETPTPLSFGPAAFGPHWRTLGQFSRGWRKSVRQFFKDAPIHEIRILSAPAHHARALWLHHPAGDVFIVVTDDRTEVLDAWQMKNWVDARAFAALCRHEAAESK